MLVDATGDGIDNLLVINYGEPNELFWPDPSTGGAFAVVGGESGDSCPSLAAGKVVTQSSVESRYSEWPGYCFNNEDCRRQGGPAGLAVDGDLTSNFFGKADGSAACTHTERDNRNEVHWWKVDLGQEQLVGGVAITSRAVPEQGGLTGASVYVVSSTDDFMSGATPCGSVPALVADVPPLITITCPANTAGRYITIFKPAVSSEQALVLCEVQVFSSVDCVEPANSPTPLVTGNRNSYGGLRFDVDGIEHIYIINGHDLAHNARDKAARVGLNGNQLFVRESSAGGGFVEVNTSPLVTVAAAMSGYDCYDDRAFNACINGLPNHFDVDTDGRTGLMFDATGDGLQDMFIVNYAARNQLFERDPHAAGSFVEVMTGPLVVGSAYSVGVLVFDATADGIDDLYVLNFNEDNQLFRRFPEGWVETGPLVADSAATSFVEVTTGSLIATTGVDCMDGLLFDATGDGVNDLYLVNYGTRNQLFEYSSVIDGWVELNTGSWASQLGLGDSSLSVAGLIFDATGDGIDDILILTVDGANQLFRHTSNTSDNWVEVTTNTLVAPQSLHSADSRAALLFDATGDGVDDLLILNCDSPNHLFRRNSVSGEFEQLTSSPLLGGNRAEPGYGQCSHKALLFDATGDGVDDLYIVNGNRWSGGEPNQLFRGPGPSWVEVDTGPLGIASECPSAAGGRTSALGPQSGMERCKDSFSALVFDESGDGLDDLYLVNVGQAFGGEANQLFRQTPEVAGGFLEVDTGPLVTAKANPPLETYMVVGSVVPGVPGGLSFDAVLFDATGDGEADMYIINNGQENQLIRRDSATVDGWVEITAGVLVTGSADSYKAILFDATRDGIDDLYVLNGAGQPNQLFASYRCRLGQFYSEVDMICFDCPKFSYGWSVGGVPTGCVYCPANTVAPTTAVTDIAFCAPCPAGKMRSARAAGCTMCPLGRTSAGGGLECQACAAGTLAMMDGVTCKECNTGIGGVNCEDCLPGHFYNRGSRYNSSSPHQPECHLCPLGGVCPGGKKEKASIYPLKGNWLDNNFTRETSAAVGRWFPSHDMPRVVYRCFADHCELANGSAPSCAAQGGGRCCTAGRAGLLCESCAVNYVNQNDRCVICTGVAWAATLGVFCTKTVAVTLVCAKLLEKASTKSCEWHLSTFLFVNHLILVCNSLHAETY
jgi:hypothetical protein